MIVMPRLGQNKTYQINTPAKLNLSLEVLGQRPDRFHELRTVMSTIRLYDTLRCDIVEDPSITLQVTQSGYEHTSQQLIPHDGKNLVLQALELLRKESQTKLALNRGIKVELVKRIPSQAGLGGGSSDAAAALVLGNQVWELGLSVDELSSLGERLGSDIPFFVHTNYSKVAKRQQVTNRGDSIECKAALCEGRGEKITPLQQVSGIPCVVIKPRFGLSTPDVFNAFPSTTLKEPEEASIMSNITHEQNNRSKQVASRLASSHWKRIGEVMSNALQVAAMQVAPSLQEIPQIMSKLPVLAHQLSGSGSAYFALCRTAMEARRVAAILRAHEVGRLYVTNTC